MWDLCFALNPFINAIQSIESTEVVDTKVLIDLWPESKWALCSELRDFDWILVQKTQRISDPDELKIEKHLNSLPSAYAQVQAVGN